MEQVVELSFDTSLHLALRDIYERVVFPPVTGYQQVEDGKE
jgi:hypothetical protein